MKHLCIYVLLSGVCIVFVCCSSPQPAFDDVRSVIIYDFKDMQKPPDIRMAVFVRLNSEAQKEGTLTLTCLSAGYTWNIGKPLSVVDTDSGYTWMGSSHIMPASGTEFPAGEYRLLYTDAASMKAETFFVLQSMPPAKNLNLSLYTAEKLAVFDEEGFLLGYDIGRESIIRSEIAEKYPGAFFTRKILLAPDGLSLVAEPSVFLSQERTLSGKGGVQ